LGEDAYTDVGGIRTCRIINGLWQVIRGLAALYLTNEKGFTIICFCKCKDPQSTVVSYKLSPLHFRV
jgi:hypothetical protein